MRFRHLDDWLSWLETLHPSAIDLGLERVRRVGERLGVLQPGVPVVTVAGTNGKGSVTALLEALLRAHGRRTALYTSPHILRFNERIRIDGRAAADADIVRALAAVDAARGDVSLTYFEFTTLAAFVLFREAGVDAWILEIGLGGRLDAVNIVDPDVAVLTSVGMDHMDYLGPTREDIGREKAGIFRPGRPAVIGEPDLPASVAEAIAARQVRALHVDRDFRAQPRGTDRFDWSGRLPGSGQASLDDLPQSSLALANTATALQALHLLPFPVARTAVERALRSVRLPGRNELLRVRGRALVIDVGHNPAALAFLVRELPRHALGARFHVVLGMFADKDIAGAVHELEPLVQSWHIAPLPGPRGAGTATLRAAVDGGAGKVPAGEPGRHAPVREYDSVMAALQGALATDDDLPVLAVGSFLTVAAVLAALPTEDKNEG